jgi:CBS-domain-containing membrane protein
MVRVTVTGQPPVSRRGRAADETVEDAARNMGELQIRRLPVLSREKRLVGIVSLGDLALKRQKSAGAALKEVSEHH